MPRVLEWRDSWTLGIESLDADHRELVRLLNLLFRCKGRAEGDTAPPAGAADSAAEYRALARCLDEIIAHARGHFEREEAFLVSIDYPEFSAHQREHALQLAEFVDLRRTLTETEARCVDEETVESIKRWFFNHVIAEDHRYAEFYRDVARPAGLKT